MPITNDDLTPSFLLRVSLTVILFVLLSRAAFFRIRGWQLQKRSRINGLRKIVTEERLARLAIKFVLVGALIALIYLRLFVDDIERRMLLGDALVTAIALCVMLLLGSDDWYSRRMVAYDRARELMGRKHE